MTPLSLHQSDTLVPLFPERSDSQRWPASGSTQGDSKPHTHTAPGVSALHVGSNQAPTPSVMQGLAASHLHSLESPTRRLLTQTPWWEELLWELEGRRESQAMFFLWQWGSGTLVLAHVGFCSQFWFFCCGSPASLLQAVLAARSSGISSGSCGSNFPMSSNLAGNLRASPSLPSFSPFSRLWAYDSLYQRPFCLNYINWVCVSDRHTYFLPYEQNPDFNRAVIHPATMSICGRSDG